MPCLTSSGVAFGRGEIFGQGLGGSLEKLHYLPEAHTDFLLAVVGKELGLIGVLSVCFGTKWLHDSTPISAASIDRSRSSIALEAASTRSSNYVDRPWSCKDHVKTRTLSS